MQQMNEEQIAELQLLYYIHTETLQADQIDKILWNENYQEWKTLINQNFEVKIIGLHGTFETIREYLSKRLLSTITLSEEAKQKQDRGMICFVKDQNTFYIAFIGLEKDYTKDCFNESIELSLFRYLKDLCSQIILLPSQSILQGWKSLDQVTDKDNSSILQEYSIQKTVDDSLEIQQVALKVDKKIAENIQQFQFAQGNFRAYYKKEKKFTHIEDSQLLNIFQQLMLGMQYNDLQLNDIKDDIKQILKIPVEKIIEQIRDIKNNIEKKSKNKLGQQFDQKIFDECWQNIQGDTGIIFFVQNYQEQIEVAKKQLSQESRDQFNLQFKNQIQLLQSCEKRDTVSSIQDVFGNFRQSIKNILDQINQNSEYLIEIQLHQFSIITDLQQNQFGIIQPFWVQDYQIKQDFNVSNPESVQFIYYFSTLKTRQNMFIIQFKNSKDTNYKYQWVALQRDNQIKTIITYRDNNQNLIFYYDESSQYLYTFNGQNGVKITKFDESSSKIESDECELIDQRVKFQELCYLNYFECFLLMDQQKNVYKWTQKNLELLQLQEKNLYYEKVFTVGSGYYYCLASLKQCDVFNFNNSKIKSINFSQEYGIEINNKKQINLFNDQQNWYICLINPQKQALIQIKNANSQQQIIQDNKEETKLKYSNPFLDIIKASVDKFGPPLQFMSTSQTITQLLVSKNIYKIIKEYFESLNIHSSDNLTKRDNLQIVGHTVKINDLMFIMITRVSFQLCTIDQSILVPLSSGQYKKEFNFQNSEKKLDIIEKIDNLNFGIFENLENTEQFQISIISIMGKQSCGKSYLMNRLFGTRFGVSSARCTDGIQMSLSKINNTIFIILDCEGLFSQRRSIQEEQKLLNFLFGISDQTLLNQDLTFSRNMNDVFSNLSNASIQGDNLYNGKLVITVRDVNQRERDQAQRELLQNIGSIQTSGMFKSFTTVYMSNFQHKSFDTEIGEVRRKFIKDSKDPQKWSSYKLVLQTMKIMLVQLQVNDNRNIQEIIFDHNKIKIKNIASKMWIKQQQNDIEGLDFYGLDQTFLLLTKWFLQDQKQDYQKIQHSNILEHVEQQIKQYLEYRKDTIIKQLQEQYQQQLQRGKGILMKSQSIQVI